MARIIELDKELITMERKHSIYGIMGIVGVIGVLIGEFLLHYNPNGYASSLPFGFLNAIPSQRIILGHFLSVFFMPFYLSGYLFTYYILAKAKPKMARWFFGIAVYIFFIGGVWIGSRAILAVMVKAGFAQGIEAYKLYIESLLQLLRIGVVVISILYSIIVWSGKTILPKWTAFLNQAVLLGIVFLLFFFVPKIGNFLIPTAMNVAHLVFFSILFLFTLKSNKQ